MPVDRPLSSKLGSLAVLALAGTAMACVSGQDIEMLQGQLSDIQRQVMVLQQQSSSKAEVSDLEDTVSQQTTKLLRSEADVQVSLTKLSGQIDQLEASLADTNFRLNDLSQQIAATNQELRAVRNQLGQANIGGSASRSPVAPPPSDPQTLYQTAYNDYLRGNYDMAVLGFRQYLDAFPDTELADNAAYWIGESRFSQGRYDQAIREFDNILSRYPRSDKLASALLKKGYAYLQMGQTEQAKVHLNQVVSRFPSSDEANLARQRLAQIGG